MFCNRVILPLLLITTCVRCHPTPPGDIQQHLLKTTSRLRRNSNEPEEQVLPFSPRRLEKMLEKAILKIITGDLTNSNMHLLKSLNYSLEEVLAIRERELNKKLPQDPQPVVMEKPAGKEILVVKGVDKKSAEMMDYEAYNRKAVEDYENIGNKMEYATPLDYDYTITRERRIEDNSNGGFHANFDRVMEPHVVFKIRYDDADIDSNSFEQSTDFIEGMKILGKASPGAAAPGGAPSGHRAGNPSNTATASDVDPSAIPEATESTTEDIGLNVSGDNEVDGRPSSTKRISEFEGLEWVEDDVYRVIPEALNYELNNYEEENETMEAEYQSGNSSIEEMTNDFEYQEDSWMENGTARNLTDYQQLAAAHRRDQAQNAIEEIKMRVLAMTGRFNLTTNSNQVQREKLTMFSPTCEIPKNTDPETWSDPFSMNMNFKMNLTSSDHIVAARLRIYKLPQMNPTVPSSSVSAVDDEEEEEKKIRISVYYYTKSLKKHRSKKRLMDSVVTPLTPAGGHLALDVRQALRFWRQPSRGTHSTSNNNHGILVQVEDQDGRPLKPASYMQQDACHTNDEDTDEKAYQRVPAIFLQACSRYVRVVNGEAVTYVNCKNLRNSQH
ncbi:uncharacterized protein LOC107037134 isoform X2 [Diachasma alloeum]|uniref:uncharacterized protein LOC107037134 isoform X2 n=1 Tax=Diachasma alloeum TaxID=454923 RepID=UPI0007380FD8|nr:uncharacterized protein LOC107037134 isoform X2 [Diachasma alloeum]